MLFGRFCRIAFRLECCSFAVEHGYVSNNVWDGWDDIINVFWLSRRIPDGQVLLPVFGEDLAGIVKAMRPFVHWYVAQL